MASTMPAVVHYEVKKGGVELRDVPVPSPGDREVVVRVGAVGVCGSDVHSYHNTQSWPVSVPVILGHEFCGQVAKLGPGVKGWKEGDWVVSETAAEIDEDSPQARAGLYNLDPHRRGFGNGRDGAMTQYVRVPTRCLHVMPQGLGPEVAAYTEPCCVAYNAVVGNARVRPGDTVVVIGPGPIGLLCAQMARLSGAGAVVVAGTSRDQTRLDLGMQTGATHAVDVEREDMKEVLRGLSDGAGADVVVDAAGVSASLASALAWVRPAGMISKVGWGPQPLNVSMDPLVQKNVTLQGSFSHNWPIWERVLRLLASGQLQVRPLISRVATLQEWQSCFEGMAEGKLLKAILKP
jgi:alcohol dehydrogenase/L-iditol 2-dehydrogenase